MREKYAPPNPDNWLDSREVCRALTITKRTLQTYRDKGLLPCARIEGKFFYREKDVAEYLNRQTVEGR